MNLEQLCTSLELSKRLKELGVKQESIFYHVYSIRHKKTYIVLEKDYLYYDKSEDRLDMVCSAFTSGELGILMPENIGNLIYISGKDKDYFVCHYHYFLANQFMPNEKNELGWYGIIDKNEANSKAKLLIYIIENNLVKIEDINARIA